MIKSVMRTEAYQSLQDSVGVFTIIAAQKSRVVTKNFWNLNTSFSKKISN